MTQKAVTQETIYSYLTVNQFCDKHTAFRVGGLRAQILNENNNGLKTSGGVVRSGRKVLINEPKYFAWLEAQNGG